MKFGRYTAAVVLERARGPHWGHGLRSIARRESSRDQDRRRSPRSSAATAAAGRGPSAYQSDAGKTASFGAAVPVNGRLSRLLGMRTRDLRLLKTLKRATVASTPLAIWFRKGPVRWN